MLVSKTLYWFFLYYRRLIMNQQWLQAFKATLFITYFVNVYNQYQKSGMHHYFHTQNHEFQFTYRGFLCNLKINLENVHVDEKWNYNKFNQK